MMVQVSAQSEDGKYLWILEPGSGNRNEFHYLYLSRILPAGGGHRFDPRVAQVATREIGCGMEKGLPVGLGAGQETLSDSSVGGLRPRHWFPLALFDCVGRQELRFRGHLASLD